MSWLDNLVPDKVIARVQDLDLESLYAAGKRALLLDLDNTLAPWRARIIEPEVAAWVQGAKELGFEIVILSNAQNPDRVAGLARQLEVAFLARAKKPLKRAFERGCALLNVTLSEAVSVGDQLLTDTWGARRAGVYSVLVRPLNRRAEFWGTKFDRAIERLLLRIELRKGLISRAQWELLWPNQGRRGASR